MKTIVDFIKPTPKRFLMFLLGLCLTLGCWVLVTDRGNLASVAALEVNATQTEQTAKLPKVVFFGSSTTVGVGATRGDRRWSTLLSKYLGWQEFNESLSGSSLSKAPRTDKSWPIPSAVERWKDTILRRKPDKIVMLYGANDALWKLPLGDIKSPIPATFRGDLKTMLTEMTVDFRPDQLVVITPQPNQTTLDRRSPYDLALQEGAQKMNIPFIDAVKETFPIGDLNDFSADGLHLNNLGHAAFASALASKMVDLGFATSPPQSQGGQPVTKSYQGVAGGFLRIDTAHPLSFGRIHGISARWVAKGNARFVIFRPDGRGGYEAIYRTPLFSVLPGITKIAVPRWWVLEGDLLGIWADTNCIGSTKLLSKGIQHFAIKKDTNSSFDDINSSEKHPNFETLAIWTGAD